MVAVGRWAPQQDRPPDTRERTSSPPLPESSLCRHRDHRPVLRCKDFPLLAIQEIVSDSESAVKGLFLLSVLQDGVTEQADPEWL